MTVVQSLEYKHESACDLFEEDHRINTRFVDVIEEVVRRARTVNVDIHYGAAGCGTCFHADEADGAIFWVAQGDGAKQEALKYDVDDDCHMSRADLGQLIVDVAEDMSVPVSWNGDPGMSVIIGVDDYFYNFEPGTRVKRTDSRKQSVGTVIDPDVWYGTDEPRVRLWDQREYDGIGAGGHLVAKFQSRSQAKEFLSHQFGVEYEGRYDTDGWYIDIELTRGASDGDNIVLFDGDSRPVIVSSTSLEEVGE